MEDIYAPNKTLDVETGTTRSEAIGTTYYYFFSFRILGDCFLENVSLAISTGATGGSYKVFLYNTTAQADHQPQRCGP